MDLQTAQRLYEFRKANGYSQEELAEKIGVSRQAISKWERSESSPDTDNLIALARLYGISIDELINGSSEPKKADEPVQETAPVQESAPAKDNVDISLKNGINVDAANGDSVHIGLDGIRVNPNNSAEFNENILKNAKKTNPLLDAIIACTCFLLFILTGAFTSGGWAYSWLFLLMIPVIITAIEAFRSKNPSVFCYPVLMVVLFCGLGLGAHIWHPTWILFITIPLYYIICEAYKKSRVTEPVQTATQGANGTYYTPNTQTSSAYAQEQSGGSKATQIVLGILLGLLIFAVIISCVIAAGVGIFSFKTNSHNDADYIIGSGEVAADAVNGIEVDWVNGNIDVQYYDGNTISFTETEETDPDRQLRYKIDEDGTLEINFCKDTIEADLSNFNINGFSKDLTVYVPQGKALTELDIDNVSAEVNINAITANKMDIDTVSGDITATGSFTTVKIDSVSATADITADSALGKFNADSVSATVTLWLPADTTGFTVDSDSVSGKVDTADFTNQNASKITDGSVIYGDGNIKIGFDTVSGHLAIKSYQ